LKRRTVRRFERQISTVPGFSLFGLRCVAPFPPTDLGFVEMEGVKVDAYWKAIPQRGRATDGARRIASVWREIFATRPIEVNAMIRKSNE